MPEWIHNRAEHIRRKNPGMPKSTSFAIATQQSHATGHTPAGYGTTEGKREAKKKYDETKSHYEQKADPSHKTKTSANLSLWKGFSDELEKIAAATPAVKLPKPMKPAGMTVMKKTMPVSENKPSYAKLNREPDAPSPVNATSPSVPPPGVTVSA